MKVKDLLIELDWMDPEAEVIFQISDGCCGDTFDLEEPWVGGGTEYLQLIFPALDFFDTCRKSGAIKDLAKK